MSFVRMSIVWKCNEIKNSECLLIDLIDLIQKQLENFKNSCISNADKADLLNKINNINQEWIVSSNETECTPTSKTVEIQTISDIIYIKGKTKYINTFRLAPTWAL